VVLNHFTGHAILEDRMASPVKREIRLYKSSRAVDLHRLLSEAATNSRRPTKIHVAGELTDRTFLTRAAVYEISRTLHIEP